MKKVILVTGASSGLGKATATFLALEGHTVYGTSRKPAGVGLPYRLIPMDVTSASSVNEAVASVIAAEGKIDVLVNNAGMGIGGAVESFSDEEVMLQMDTNFNGLARVTSAVLPHMRNRRSGTVINISSIGGIIGLPFQGLYSAAKFAIEGYSEALAMEVKSWNIRVVVVNPGDFKTGFTGARIMTRKDAAGSDYSQLAEKAVAIMGKDEQSGCDPMLMGRTIGRIVTSRSPKYRYIVGRFDQKLIATIRHWLPSGLIRWIIADHYKVR